MIRRATELRKFKKEGNDVTKEVAVLTVVGNFTSDAPELKTVTVNGEETVVLGEYAFSIAVNRGQNAPAVFFKVEAWGATAERLAKFAKKGGTAVLVGEVKDDSYTPDGGTKIEKEKIVVSDFQVIKTTRKPAATDAANPSTANEQAVDDSYGFQEVPADDYDDVPF